MDKPAYYKLLIHFHDDKATLEELKESTGLASSSIKKYLNVLEARGFVKRAGYPSNIFILTNKGRLLKETIISLRSLPPEKIPEYIITDPNTGTPVPLRVRNHKQLLAILKYGLVEPEVFMEHVKRKYLVEWLRSSLGDKYLSALIESGEIKTIDEFINEVEKIVKILEKV